MRGTGSASRETAGPWCATPQHKDVRGRGVPHLGARRRGGSSVSGACTRKGCNHHRDGGVGQVPPLIRRCATLHEGCIHCSCRLTGGCGSAQTPHQEVSHSGAQSHPDSGYIEGARRPPKETGFFFLFILSSLSGSTQAVGLIVQSEDSPYFGADEHSCVPCASLAG